MFLVICFSNRNISFSLIVQSKRVRFQDEDKANKQGDDIEDRPAQGNQGNMLT